MGNYPRQSGIILHPTSLPCKYGVGEIGGSIYKFIDLLDKMEQSIWQILPLGPTGYGDSPYQSFSSFAGNPLLISIEELVNDGLLDEPTFIPDFNTKKVDFGPVINYKFDLILQSYQNFKEREIFRKEFDEFCNTQSNWLETYALYRTIKTMNMERPWSEWDPEQRDLDEKVIKKIQIEKSDEINYIKYRQFIFDLQWNRVRKYAKSKDITIVGDIPIFVAYDSEEAWANQNIFLFSEAGIPEFVAGVPPDYFSSTGQLWGNPCYDWDELEKTNFDWWIKRIKRNLEFVDLLRIDHFRGFVAFWAIPYGEDTAINGEWVKVNGRKFFETLKKEMGELPILAEDLGIITEEVSKLRDDFGFPSMKILQYGFSEEQDSRNSYLPHNYPENSVAFTGTHDNDTSFGWYINASKKVKKHILKYTGSNEQDIVSDMLRVLWSSVAMFAIAPMQDILREKSDCRMNTPGTPSGNWQWRLTEDQFNEKERFNQIKEFSRLYRRSKKFRNDGEYIPHQ